MLALWAAGAAAQECEATCFQKRWVYWGGNLMVTERDSAGRTPFENFNALLPTIKAAGFNGVALNLGGDGSYVQLVNPETSADRKKAISDRIKLAIGNANAAGLEVIPIGGHPELVSQLRPDLMEAFPTTTLYKAQSGVASCRQRGQEPVRRASGLRSGCLRLGRGRVPADLRRGRRDRSHRRSRERPRDADAELESLASR
ncbi:hypothetical protein DPH57_07220 [Massilia sp. YMA4]|nr:hypothetical protein DPH57_07220 [Massilia sp. YMA4]